MPPKRIGYGPNIRPGFSEKYGQVSSANYQYSQNGGNLYNGANDASFFSKPHSNYANDNPYAFENNNKQGIHNKQPYIPLSPSTTKTETTVQQHVHHHYVHGDSNKEPNVIIKPVAIPVGSVGSLSHLQSQQATDVITAGGADFSGFSTGGFKPMTGSYHTESKPIFESDTIYGSKYQQQNYNKGSSNLNNQQLPGPYANNAYDDQKYTNSLGAYSNTDFYKKEFNVGTSNNVYNQGPATFTQNSYQQHYQEGKAQGFDCVCVNYDQCPSQEIIGRRDDLYLPIDPRNKGSEITALSDEQLDNVTISDKNDEINENTTTVPENKAETVKTISKRDVTEEETKEATKQIEPVSK